MKPLKVQSPREFLLRECDHWLLEMNCHLCGQAKLLIEAHIVPRCLLSSLRTPAAPIIQLSAKRGTYPRATQTGEYDRTILCAECDNSLSPFDEYACEILLPEPDPTSVSQGPSSRWYLIPRYDYTRLKLFFLSTLWRMSVSTRPVFKDVTLGHYGAEIREMVIRRDPGKPEVFPVFLIRYTDNIGKASMIGTRRERMKDVNVMQMGLPGYVATIKVDRRPLPFPIDEFGFVLQPDRPLLVPLREMSKGTEWPHIRKIIISNARRVER